MQHLRGLLEDAWSAVETPHDIGLRWSEHYLGTPADPVSVCVDAMSNVLHVRYSGPESLSVVYLPGWFYEVATAALAGRAVDPAATTVVDLAVAGPLAFDLTVENPVRNATRTVTVSGEAVGYTPLAFGYAFTPARGFAVTESVDLATDPAALFHWGAMSLRLAAAPGVGFEQRPLLGAADLAAVRAAYVPGVGPVTCDQALRFEFERHRSPTTVPPLGAPLRPTPLAEPDVVASAVTVAHAYGQPAGAPAGQPSGEPTPVAVQLARPDGVDLLLMKPDLRRAPRGTPWGWQPEWMVEAAKVVDDAVFSLLVGMFDTYVEWLGGLPETAPAPIHIRVDPASAADRFAYLLEYLTPDREVSTEPTTSVSGDPSFRLTVVRTKAVQVFLDKAAGAAAESDLKAILEYRETVVDHFDDVPISIVDSEQVGTATLPARPATLEELLRIIVTIGEFVPHPAIQAMYDVRDLGSVASYVLTGGNLYGEPMSGLEAAVTLGGVLVPEVAERVGKSLLASGRRVVTMGDSPTPRLRAAADGVEPADATYAGSLAERAAAR